MRQILQFLCFFSLALILGGPTPAQAAAVGSGKSFTAIVQAPAGILGIDADGIWLSTDDGASFSHVYSEDSVPYFALAPSEDTVIAVGRSGSVLRSTDGGNNWSEVDASGLPSLFGDLISVTSRGDGVWLATGDTFDAHIWRSTDDGQTWAELNAPNAPTATGLRAIAWQADTGWILAGEGGFGEGIVYQSSDDGDTWELLADGLAAPINAVAINGSGQIAVVGEGGLFLQGSTDSDFISPAGDSVSEDLHAVIAGDSGSFVAGGDSGALITLDSNGTVDSSLANGPDIQAVLSLGDENLLVSGVYEPPATVERSIPFRLLVARDADSGDFVLTVEETLTDRNYHIESSINLQDWSDVSGSERTGNGAAQVWTFPEEGTRLFWRVVEL